jgi:putative glycosyltransferase
MKFSIVTTMYNSGAHIGEFYTRMAEAVSELSDDYEMIFVDDGSPDNSLALALDLQKRDSRIKIIELSRNFGHHNAIFTALAHATGERVFLIDCDLEEPPEAIVEFEEKLRESDCDAVYGVQIQRKGGLVERVSGRIFYALFNFLSTEKIPTNLLTVRLMKRDFVSALLSHGESELYFAGLFAITGFRQEALPVKKTSLSASQYSFGRKSLQAVRAITSFSEKPLYLLLYLGLVISAVSAGYIVFIVGQWALFGLRPGFASIIASIWFLGGVTILGLGIIGIYLARVFLEAKNRPLSIIRKIHD